MGDGGWLGGLALTAAIISVPLQYWIRHLANNWPSSYDAPASPRPEDEEGDGHGVLPGSRDEVCKAARFDNAAPRGGARAAFISSRICARHRVLRRRRRGRPRACGCELLKAVEYVDLDAVLPVGLRLGERGVAPRAAGRRRLRAFVHSAAGGVRGARSHCGRRCAEEGVRRRRRRRPWSTTRTTPWRPASAVWFLACASVHDARRARRVSWAVGARLARAARSRRRGGCFSRRGRRGVCAGGAPGRPGERGAAGRRRAGVRVAAARVAGAGARRVRRRGGRGRRRRAGRLRRGDHRRVRRPSSSWGGNPAIGRDCPSATDGPGVPGSSGGTWKDPSARTHPREKTRRQIFCADTARRTDGLPGARALRGPRARRDWGVHVLCKGCGLPGGTR